MSILKTLGEIFIIIVILFGGLVSFSYLASVFRGSVAKAGQEAALDAPVKQVAIQGARQLPCAGKMIEALDKEGRVIATQRGLERILEMCGENK